MRKRAGTPIPTHHMDRGRTVKDEGNSREGSRLDQGNDYESPAVPKTSSQPSQTGRQIGKSPGPPAKKRHWQNKKAQELSLEAAENSKTTNHDPRNVRFKWDEKRESGRDRE